MFVGGLGYNIFSDPGVQLYDWLRPDPSAPASAGPPTPAGGTVYSAPIGPALPMAVDPRVMQPAVGLANPRQPLYTHSIFQTPAEVFYNLTHPTEPGSGQLTTEQLASLAADTPSYVPGETLVNPEGTGALQQLGGSLTWLAGNIGWLIPVGVVLVLVGPELVRALVGGRR